MWEDLSDPATSEASEAIAALPHQPRLAADPYAVIQPVLAASAAQRAGFLAYDSASDAPKAANELLARDDDGAWRSVTLASEQN